jgi:hypothetical protein
MNIILKKTTPYIAIIAAIGKSIFRRRPVNTRMYWLQLDKGKAIAPNGLDGYWPA